MVGRFSVWWVDLNPTQGSEQAGHRPVVVVSPDEMNNQLRTVIIAPLTSRRRHLPSRVAVRHEDKQGEVALDQIRAIDQARLGRSIGDLAAEFHAPLLTTLGEIFAR